ncbi:MAG: hypothetical protein ACLFU2_08920 [Opitutales bacterium]
MTIQFEPHPEENWLHALCRDEVRAGDLSRHFPQLEAALATLEPGFGIVADLSGLETMEHACAAEVQQLMDCFNRAGVERVARLPAPSGADIGLGIMSAFHYGPEVRIRVCQEWSDALAFARGPASSDRPPTGAG